MSICGVQVVAGQILPRMSEIQLSTCANALAVQPVHPAPGSQSCQHRTPAAHQDSRVNSQGGQSWQGGGMAGAELVGGTETH